MGKFDEGIAKNSKVEMIHVSLDSTEDAATEWATKEQFPWLTILPEDVEKSGIKAYQTERYVPFYVLVDADGEPVGTGSGVFDKAKKLK